MAVEKTLLASGNPGRITELFRLRLSSGRIMFKIWQGKIPNCNLSAERFHLYRTERNAWKTFKSLTRGRYEIS